MSDIKLIDRLSKTNPDLQFVGNWPDVDGKIPIYHACSTHAFNRVVGYARFINASSGTVLYRGQTKPYSSLLPSGARATGDAVSDNLLADILADKGLMEFFHLNRKEILGWHQYQSLMVESILQHYGAKTYCMDFVDNHWCALWFGLYEFKNDHYHKRTAGEKLFVFLYVADTTGPSVEGMYIGADTYTVDLRKALPSTFQRPASQHGWIVRNRDRKKDPLDNRVIGIIEVDVSDAEKWLGEGTLLSETNFFPSFSVDQGYNVLLSRQSRSGVPSRRKKVLPQKTVRNYHFSELYYSHGDADKLPATSKISSLKGLKGQDLLTRIYSILLNYGWAEETCSNNAQWDEYNPCAGQSATTALVLQDLLGGDIYSFDYSNRNHFYNVINGIIVDMTYTELNRFQTIDYHHTKSGKIVSVRSLKNLKNRYKDKTERLLLNCAKS